MHYLALYRAYATISPPRNPAKPSEPLNAFIHLHTHSLPTHAPQLLKNVKRLTHAHALFARPKQTNKAENKKQPPQPHLSFPLRSLNALPSPLPPCMTVSKNAAPVPPASNEPMPANNPFLP